MSIKSTTTTTTTEYYRYSKLSQALCIVSKPWVNWNWSYSLEILNSGQNRHFFVPRDLEIRRMTLKINKAHLNNIKLCVSFHHHMWIQTKVTVRKRQIWVKIDDFFLSRATLKFDRWPWKTIWHLFNATSSFVHRFKAIGEFKLELQSGNA